MHLLKALWFAYSRHKLGKNNSLLIRVIPSSVGGKKAFSISNYPQYGFPLERGRKV